jgi:hypothetical protein
MGLNLTLYANVRQTSPESYSSGQSQVDQNPRGDLCFAPALLPKTELTRLANSWYAVIPTGSAFTNVAGMPTTRAELAIYNNYTDTTNLVIDQIWFASLTSITAAANVTIIAQVAQVTALTDNTAVLISSPLGKTYSGNVQRALAVTTMTANKWSLVGSGTTGGATASIGSGAVAEIGGSIIVKPGFTLGVNAVVGTATGTSIMGVLWHEVKLPAA